VYHVPTTGFEAIGTPTLWVSTLFLLLSGTAVESGAQYSRRARLAEVGRWLWVSLELATLFAVAQAMGMADLLHAHQLSSTTRAIIGLNGLAFSLVLIHAVNVLGGMVLLTTLSVRASVGPSAYSTCRPCVAWRSTGISSKGCSSSRCCSFSLWNEF